MDAVVPARSSADLLLLEWASAVPANQQLLSSQLLLSFTFSGARIVRERAMKQVWKLCGFMASTFRQQVRRREHSSLLPLPLFASQSCLYSLGVSERQAWALRDKVGALSMFLP